MENILNIVSKGFCKNIDELSKFHKKLHLNSNADIAHNTLGKFCSPVFASVINICYAKSLLYNKTIVMVVTVKLYKVLLVVHLITWFFQHDVMMLSK